jgi:translocation and assembly module TamB
MDLDLGDGFTFSAEGLDTTLAGRVKVTSGGGTLAGRGTISAVRGTYYAFGQRLTIERGRLIFAGPLDNPALDIVALRKNLAVEAGVELTGTVKVPQVRLVSMPPVPDGEKLAWLVTGRGLDRATAADLSTLSLASAALLGSGGRPISAQIAQRFGLDDIAFRSGGVRRANGDPPLAGQVVSFGKRLTDDLTIAYEQGLTIASNALRIEYALTRTLTLRAEAGTISSIGVFYRRAFE